MSNERIDEIIGEHINISYKTNLEHIRRIRKAMEQYGLEQSKDGYKTAALAEHYRSVGEIDRLKELVKAQKELIALYDEENLSDPAWLKESELREQIKTLEQ